MDVRRSLLAASMAFTTPATIANAGDVAYWDGSKVKTTPLSSRNTSLGTPVGVVVVPEGFAPDGKARICGLFNASTSADGCSGSNRYDESLINHEVVPITDNISIYSTGSNYAGHLPSDAFSGRICVTDTHARYQAVENMIPSPYYGKSPNPEYYKTLSGKNALSDFNGLVNTTTLVTLGSNYRAANAAWSYNDGVSNLQGYLPGMGELGYIMPRLNVINNVISKLNGDLIDRNMGSSTEEYIYYVGNLVYYDGAVKTTPKSGYYGDTRAYAILDNTD